MLGPEKRLWAQDVTSDPGVQVQACGGLAGRGDRGHADAQVGGVGKGSPSPAPPTLASPRQEHSHSGAAVTPQGQTLLSPHQSLEGDP